MYENEKVIHKKFGEGIVQSCDETYIFVSFENNIKQFDYDIVFTNELLKFENNDLQAKIDREFEEKRIQRSKEKEEELNAELLKAKKKREDEEAARKEAENKRKQEQLEAERKAQLRKEEKANKEKLLQELHKYKFEGFLHTTELENFNKIVDDGYIWSRDYLDKHNIEYTDSADQDVISRTDPHTKSHCRFYYYFQTPTNYRAEYKHPVIMVYDENLIYNENCQFTSQNAAKYTTTFASNMNEVLSFPWDGIFERGYYSQSKYYRIDENGSDQSSHERITGMRNAEFLIRDKVSISNIVKVYFKYQEDLDKAKTFCPKELISKFYLDGSKFN